MEASENVHWDRALELAGTSVEIASPSTLRQAARAIAVALTVRDLETAVAETLPVALGCSRCELFLIDEKHNAAGGTNGTVEQDGSLITIALALPFSPTRNGRLSIEQPAVPPTSDHWELYELAGTLLACALDRALLAQDSEAPPSLGDLARALADDRDDDAEKIRAKLRLPLDVKSMVVAFDLPELDLRVSTAANDAPRAPAKPSLSTAELALVSSHPTAVTDMVDGRLLAVIPTPRADDKKKIVQLCEAISESEGVCAGLAGPDSGIEGIRVNLTAASRAVHACRMLHRQGGVLHQENLGPYRLLVDLDLDLANEDRLCQGVTRLAQYDGRHLRRSDLVLTLETYLEHGRRVTASAKKLFIHPNTMRQRLARIENLSRLDLAAEDQMSLEIAVKLVRLKLGIPPSAD